MLSSPVSEHGFIGYSPGLLSSNIMPDYSAGENFFTVFGVFFPAATGETALVFYFVSDVVCCMY